MNAWVMAPHRLCLRTYGWMARYVESVDGDAGTVMAKLIYASNMSLDGCTAYEWGAFDWAPRAG